MALLTASLDGSVATQGVWTPIGNPASGQTVQYFTGEGFWLSSQSNVTLRNGTVAATGYVVNGNELTNTSGITLQDVTMRHYQKDPATSNHVDGLLIWSGCSNSSFTRLLVEDCSTYMILCSGGCTNLTFTDCWLGASTYGTASFGFGSGHGDDVFTNVTLDGVIMQELGLGTTNTFSGCVIKNCRIGWFNRLSFARTGITWQNVTIGTLSSGTTPIPPGVTVDPNVDLSKPAWAAGR